MPVVSLKPTIIEAGRLCTAEEIEKDLVAHHKTPASIYGRIKTACKNNNAAELKELFDEWLAGDYKIEELSFAMDAAVRNDNVAIVSTFISHGIGCYTSYSFTAVQHKAKGVLLEFLKDNWDINEPFAEGWPPALGYADQDEDMVSWLLEHGADPNQQSLIDITPLSVAVRDAAPSTIKLLLDHPGTDRGLSVNKKLYEDHPLSYNQYFWMGCGTPLHDAANVGKLHVVRYLLEHGADPTIRDAKDRTPLDWAVKHEHFEVVTELRAAMESRES
ncbi:putative hspc200 [Aspergillus heterothallicus]